ncbi:hypothetical protein BN424_62 [Carnobacterium maltaromaticum LMA28]|uniref:Uncharacterized protein n=1 Tax=Carnobacterium maltaromaticum LMA28 TaxID=1234679 RepID=K8E1G4_CARML|nr:hypothetical protein BN424_62 [Carnobacterium maltaromaticum LMA28]
MWFLFLFLVMARYEFFRIINQTNGIASHETFFKVLKNQ